AGGARRWRRARRRSGPLRARAGWMRRRAVALLLCLWAPLAACDSQSRTAAPGPTAAPAPAAPAAADAPLEGHLVSRATVARVLERGVPPQWFGMYAAGKKIGYGHLELRPARPGEPGRLVSSPEARMGGGGADIALHEDRFYQGEPPHLLLEIRQREESGGAVVERRYRRDGDHMVAAQVIDGRAQPQRRIAASRETLVDALDEIAVDPASAAPGRTVRVPGFDTTAERDRTTEVTVVEVGARRIAGVDTEVVVLRSLGEGEQTPTRTVLASGAVMLSTAIGEGMELRREEPAQAQSDVVGFDIIGDAVPVDRALGDPAALGALDLIVTVPRGFRLRDAPNQEISRRPDGALEVAIRSRPGLPVLPDERRAALAATAAIDAGDPAIAALAREIIGQERDRAAQVERLVRWVHQHVAKDL